MNDMRKWDELFGGAFPLPPDDVGSAIEDEICPICGKRRWERIGPGSVQMACDCADSLQHLPPQPVDDHAVTITIKRNGEHVAHETALRGTWTESGGFVIPFASVENAVDCLRMVIRSLEREAAS